MDEIVITLALKSSYDPPFAFVEAKGRLERLGLSCLKRESTNQIYGLCDQTGRVFGLLQVLWEGYLGCGLILT